MYYYEFSFPFIKVLPSSILRMVSSWRTAQVFISLIRFLLYILVSSSFLVLLKYYFLLFPFISICLRLSASNMPKYFEFSFSPNVLIFLDLIVPFLSLFAIFNFIISRPHFPMPNSIPFSWLYILMCQWFESFCVCVGGGKQLYVVYVHMVVNLVLRFRKFVPTCAFPNYVI